VVQATVLGPYLVPAPQAWVAVGLALGLGSGEGQAWVAVGLALGLGSGEGQAGVAVGLALGLGSGEGRAWVAVGLALGLGLAEGRAVTVQGTSGLDRDRALVDVRGPAAEKGQSPHCAAMVAGLGRIALHRSGLETCRRGVCDPCVRNLCTRVHGDNPSTCGQGCRSCCRSGALTRGLERGAALARGSSCLH